MSEEMYKAFYKAVEKGIKKGIEEVGIENVDWCNIKLQDNETFSDKNRIE